jgi:hypothetical protein
MAICGQLFPSLTMDIRSVTNRGSFFGTHNGYGWANHARGLVARGVHCELVDNEGMKSLRLSPHHSNDKDILLDAPLAWADKYFAYVPGHAGTRLQVDRHGRFIVDHAEFVDATGGFEPALWASRTLDPVLRN